MTDEVEELLRVLGPFYELIEEKKKITQISDLSTGGVLFSRCNSATFHSVCDVRKRHVELNHFFFYNLPLVRCSARLTIFARQLEGKYMTVPLFDSGGMV